MRILVRFSLGALMLVAGQPIEAQTVSDLIEELAQLHDGVVGALDTAVSNSQQGDREGACSSAKYAQSLLTKMDKDVNAIDAAVASSSDYDADARSKWAALADKIRNFVREEREVALTDWQRTC